MEPRLHDRHETPVDDHDRGLAFNMAPSLPSERPTASGPSLRPHVIDRSALVHRRQALKFLGGAAVVAVAAACGSSNNSDSKAASTTSSAAGGSSTTTTSGATGSSTTPIPEETAGPFPGDGTNGPNVLTESGIVRRDIRSSFGSSNGSAAGVPATVQLTVLDSATGGAMPGAAVYLWHCDRDGNYSMYSQGAADQNYLRGVQEAGSDGSVAFTTIFPGAYSGRWPHMHFEVYPSLAEATKAGTPVATSQLALPEDSCRLVYAADGYEQSVTNLARTSLTTDMVFSDGVSQQTPKVTGNVADGMSIALNVPV
jgi:protocatechuate 3,4-dioxygenase beta subunit